MSVTIVIGVRHPLEFTEEAAAKEFPQWLGILDLQGLLYSLFCHLDDLVCHKFVRKISQ
jgi:hypothetical protein